MEVFTDYHFGEIKETAVILDPEETELNQIVMSKIPF
ncbi:hypothetical protein ES703_112469 [subsurface metagenome]